jgi:hypothetical protein
MQSDVLETSGQRTRSARKGNEREREREREEKGAGHDVNSTETIVAAPEMRV